MDFVFSPVWPVSGAMAATDGAGQATSTAFVRLPYWPSSLVTLRFQLLPPSASKVNRHSRRLLSITVVSLAGMISVPSTSAASAPALK